MFLWAFKNGIWAEVVDLGGVLGGEVDLEGKRRGYIVGFYLCIFR